MVRFSFEIEHRSISSLIDIGKFDLALAKTQGLLEQLNNYQNKTTPQYYLDAFNLAGLCIDIGSMSLDTNTVRIGAKLMVDNEIELLKLVTPSEFYYNLANAKSALVSEQNPFTHTFQSIEEVVELKNLYWKALKETTSKSGKAPYELIVNLANSLKQQFRISEALTLYDHALSLNPNCTQALVNRSETLLMLNTITSNLSIQMLRKISDGYQKASECTNIPEDWAEYYASLAIKNECKIKEFCGNATNERIAQDDHETALEFKALSKYRQFCLSNNLSLSEHGLYCHCEGSARDNLTIPNIGGVAGDFIVPMELVLNRFKSEFSFSRKLYFEYVTNEQDDDLQHESCFSELFNDELLGIDVEKLRTSFKLCFGIL